MKELGKPTAISNVKNNQNVLTVAEDEQMKRAHVGAQCSEQEADRDKTHFQGL